MTWRKWATVTAVAASGMLLAACNGSAVSQEALEQQISHQLEEQVGVAPAAVDCPGNLDAEVGTTMRCVITADDASTVGVTVTVYEVDGDDVKFHIEVDENVTPPPSTATS